MNISPWFGLAVVCIAHLVAAEPLTAALVGQRAIKNSTEIDRRAAIVAGAVADAKAIELARIPRLSAGATYTRLSKLDPVLLGPGVAFLQPTKSTAFSAELVVPLSDYAFTFPVLVRAARAGVSASKAARLAAERSVQTEAERAFFEWMRATMHVAVAEQFLAQISATETQVSSLVRAERASKADALAITAQVSLAKQQVTAAKHGANMRGEHLRILIGASDDEALTIGEQLPESPALPVLPDLGQQVQSALTARQDVRTLDMGLRALIGKRRASGVGRWPRIAAFAAAQYANPNERVFPIQEVYKGTWAAGVSLSWNLSEALDADAKLDKAQAEIDELEASRAALSDGVRMELVGARGALQLAHATIAAASERVAAASEAHRVRSALLDAGRATVMEVVAAQTQLTEAQTALINARIDWRQAEIDLAYASGATAQGTP